MPSKGFGWPSCSLKHKVNPTNKYCNNLELFKKEWKSGNKITKVIGIDAGEDHRIKQFLNSDSDAIVAQAKKYDTVFPLVDWDMDRDDCIQAIKDAGMEIPKKSSCYFCPSMKKHEIRELDENHPDLMKMALYMEQNALDGGRLTSCEGLGRSKAWKDVVAQGDLFKGYVGDSEACVVCYDG